ncbi:hypothetical protein [Vibrio phage phiKT1024]|nr:hypothetical protein [Vibrio phage phiKT1024]
MFFVEIIAISVIGSWLIMNLFQREGWRISGKWFRTISNVLTLCSLLYLLYGVYMVDYTEQSYYQTKEVSTEVKSNQLIQYSECEKVTYQHKENYFFMTAFSGSLMERTHEPANIEKCLVKKDN